MAWRLIRNIYAAVRGEVRRHGLIGFFCRVSYYLRHFGTHLAFLASRTPAADGGLFNKEPQVPCDIRLHPDLSGIGEPIHASVSIVIPTLNAGPEFPWLLRKLGAQRGLRGIEIVIVDSGSHDGTVEIARAAGCTVVEIPPSDFSHSYARNTGADAACGDYLLFMVQDAYPIGDYWVYGILCYLLEHADQKLVATSCAEYSRSDSDMMYDSMINTHYRFLGCLDYDSIGKYQGDDHMSLRSYGQLSDVSCLISREIFARYNYRNDYAEDLDLGIRLIKDGYSVAMLASVKVVHSHDRPAYYYLKRSFVDVIFLVGMFDDFVYPHIDSASGLIAGIVSLATHLTDWIADFNDLDTGRMLHDELSEWIQTWRRSFSELRLDKYSRLGDAPLDTYIESLADRYLSPTDEVLDGDVHHEARRFLDAFFARLEHFDAFAGVVYGEQDAGLRKGLCDAVLKTFAATAGSALGFMCIDLAQAVGGEGEMAQTITNELKTGI
jgi:glycosyltransferase involved in cell wall biosynthesis